MTKINNKIKTISQNFATLAKNFSELADILNDDFSLSKETDHKKANFFQKKYLAYSWNSRKMLIEPLEKIQTLPLELLINLDIQKDKLLENTVNFAKGLPANNALLWGARGSGKSALIKSVVAYVAKQNYDNQIAIIEIDSVDINALDLILEMINNDANVVAKKLSVIIFCDDLSFEKSDQAYKTLKNTLFGSLKTNMKNVILYATSNKRQLVTQPSTEDLMVSVIKKDELEEAVSLSDRFGLWLGFHSISETVYLEIIEKYLKYQQKIAKVQMKESDDWKKLAKLWAKERGSTSGRTAYHFVLNYLASQNQTIDF